MAATKIGRSKYRSIIAAELEMTVNACYSRVWTAVSRGWLPEHQQGRWAKARGEERRAKQKQGRSPEEDRSTA